MSTEATYELATAAGLLQITVGQPRALAAVRLGWLTSELAFLAQTCRLLAPSDLARLVLRYTSAAVAAELDGLPAVVTVEVVGDATTVPGRLTVRGASGQHEFRHESKPFGQVIVVHELRRMGVYLLRIRPGGTIPWHVHRIMSESEMVVGAGVVLQGSRVPRGLTIRWPHGHPHRYDNPTSEVQTVLCVDSPAFIPADEIPVPAPRTPSFPSGVVRILPDARIVTWT